MNPQQSLRAEKSQGTSRDGCAQQLEFLAYSCQEMRTPLNTIIGAAQVMKDQLYGESRIKNTASMLPTFALPETS